MTYRHHLNEILNLILYFLLLIQHYLSAETVVYRIFYCLNRIGSGRLTLRELKCGNLLDSLWHTDDEVDINKVLRYFSDEHFYVIYCKFLELDTDHDFFIDKENLMKFLGNLPAMLNGNGL